MLPSSDDLEALVARVKQLSTALAKLKGAEVSRAALKTEAAAIARDWLRVSPALRDAAICEVAKLDAYDAAMQAILGGANNRVRASALVTKLKPFLNGAFDAVVAPLIRYQGSPRQVLARQVQAAFTATLTSDEAAYVNEAASCVTVQANRAAIIMLWAAGVAHIHAAIERRGFPAYNQAVDTIIARGKKVRPFTLVNAGSKANSVPELQLLKDAELLVAGMELFQYDIQVYQKLDQLLRDRNGAAHPGEARVKGPEVEQFATKLNDYLFAKIT